MQDTNQRHSLLKEAGQDFEWYPTTSDMIDAVFNAVGDISSMLDIGAGDGRVLERIDKLTRQRYEFDKSSDKYSNTHYRHSIDKYAIEKSPIHIENMPPDICIVGTDFLLQALIDKEVDAIFCNPPYSEYESWAVKIIKEANAGQIFLILPSRWAESPIIKQAIKLRGAADRIIWAGDFLDSERAARAKVDIIKITISTKSRSYNGEERDPFDVWFDEYFADFDKLEHIQEEPEEDEDEKINPMRNIVKGRTLIEHLYTLYQAEMNKLLNNYKNLSQLDGTLLKEIGVSVGEIKEALKMKIKGLKNKYWKELFNNLDKITERLTSKSRETMLEKMRANCNVDFSVDNAFAVVIWVIKNANQYIDDQLVDMFKELSEPECVKNYKSNLKTWEQNRWRYKNEANHTHYTLEYRIITQRHSAIETGEYYSHRYHNGLAENCHTFISDIQTIANNLGFSNQSNSECRQWESNKEQEFWMSETGVEGRANDNSRTFVKIRAFKNGNLHLKFDQTFIKTLNVEASRLLGWIKTPEDAVYEMGLDSDFVKARFKCNLLIGTADGQRLLTGN